jgi:hypothetical protein
MVPPVRLLIVAAASNARQDMTLLEACHVEPHISKAADSDDMLLQQPYYEDKLRGICKVVQ